MVGISFSFELSHGKSLNVLIEVTDTGFKKIFWVIMLDKVLKHRGDINMADCYELTNCPSLAVFVCRL